MIVSPQLSSYDCLKQRIKGLHINLAIIFTYPVLLSMEEELQALKGNYINVNDVAC